jgi:hypothetical protein
MPDLLFSLLSDLSLLGANIFDARRKLSVSLQIDRAMLYRGAGWVDAQVIVSLQVASGTMGASSKATAAIRADIAQDVIYTAFTKSAFKRTDHCFGRVGWELLVAMFACGS